MNNNHSKKNLLSFLILCIIAFFILLFIFMQIYEVTTIIKQAILNNNYDLYIGIKNYRIQFNPIFIFLNKDMLLLTITGYGIFYFLFIYYYFVNKNSKFFNLFKGRNKNYSSLASKNEIKKDLSVIEFNSDGERVSEKIKLAGLPILTYKNKIFVDSTKSHSLIVGTTNSGKTYSLIHGLIQACRLNGENMVINDVKGELYDTHYRSLVDSGYKVYALNFTDPINSSYFNPLKIITTEYRNAFKDYLNELEENKEIIYEYLKDILKDLMEFKFDYKKAQDILLIIPDPDYSNASELISDFSGLLFESSNDKDVHWNESGANLLEGIIFYLLEDFKFEDNKRVFIEDKKINLLSISNIAQYVNDPTNPLKNNLAKKRLVTDFSVMRLTSIVSAAPATLTSIVNVFGRVMKKFYISKQIINLLSNNDIDLEELDKNKIAIFIIVHDEKQTYHSLVSLIICQIYQTVIKLTRGKESGTLDIPLHIIWDEFAYGSIWKLIDNALAASRSRLVKFYLVIQDYGQLDNLYGKAKAQTIKSNTANTVFLLSASNETNEYFSNICDVCKYYDEDTKTYKENKLITTAFLKQLPLGTGIVTSLRKKPYITKFLGFDKYVYQSYLKKLKKENKIQKIKRKAILNIPYVKLLD